MKLKFPRPQKKEDPVEKEIMEVTDQINSFYLFFWKVSKFLLKIAVPAFVLITWLFFINPCTQMNVWVRTIFSAGIGYTMVHAAFWAFKGDKAIKHEVWCKGRKECGE